MALAARWVRSHGGIEGSRVFTRIWMATLGRWDWDDLPVLPPEILFLPSWAPLNIYDFGCWARQTVVALSVVMAHRPARPLPFDIDELRAGGRQAPAAGRPRPRPGLRGAARAFALTDRVLHRYERLPSWVVPRQILRKTALARAERWILSRQEADGLWGAFKTQCRAGQKGFDRRGEEVLFRVEEAVDRPLGHVGSFSDIADRDLVVAAGLERLDCRVHYPGPTLGGISGGVSSDSQQGFQMSLVIDEPV
jgi:hypothetical protein